MTAIDRVLEHAASERLAAAVDAPKVPRTGLVVLACMDARLDPVRVLGLRPGDAHLLRNAGAVVTEEILFALAVSQRVLGTSEVLILQHTDCGALTLDQPAFLAEIEAEVGRAPRWAARSPAPLEDTLREAVATVQACPYLPHVEQVRGAIYDVASGTITEVS